MKRNILISNRRCELQDGCAINYNACKNMQCKNAVVKYRVASPMFQRIIGEVRVFRNQFVQKKAEEGEPKNGD